MKILVSINSSDCSRRAIEHLRLSNMAQGARVRFVHVRSNKETSEEVAEILSRTVVLEGALGIETLFAEGPVADAIVRMADQWQADLIVLGTNDRHGIERLLLGSVSQSVLSKAH